MHAIALRSFFLVTACLASVPVLAGVGGTSAGITTNIPGQSTDPSADVQAQSAGFVQQNQQVQNGATVNGAGLPASASGAAAGQGNTANNGDARQKSGGADPVAAQVAVPPPPPPSPPTYVSVVKHVTPQSPDISNAEKPDSVVVPVVTPAVQLPAAAAAEKTDPSPVIQVPVPVAASHAAGNFARAKAADANVEKNATPDHAVSAPAVTGGRGEAPDGFAFYTGLGVALLLLAVALATYLRTQRDEAAIRPPGG